MRPERIKQILEQLECRTAWGVCLDIRELERAKTEAESLVAEVKDAMVYIQEFVNTHMKNTAKCPDSEDD